MTRYTLAIWAATSVGAIVAFGACSEEIQDAPRKVPPQGGVGGTGGNAGTGATGATGAAGGAGGTGAQLCTGGCCPEDKTCYSDPSVGNGSPGSECLATQDNTGKNHFQLRQQWIRPTEPPGNAGPVVYAALSQRTQLPWPQCHQVGATFGTGGYIQLIDVDLDNHVSLLGYSTYVPAPAGGGTPSVIADGFCLGAEDYTGNPTYQLDANNMSPSTNYPTGLPHPMPLKNAPPWHVTPAKAKQLDQDFDLSTDRAALLQQISTTLAADGYNGVFYYDPVKNYMHGYSPLSWTIVYDAFNTTHLSIPIREAEVKGTFNDGTHNCMGRYRADKIDQLSCDPGIDQANPGWGCAVEGDSCKAGEAPATTDGYFLITELEQIYTKDLGKTLCASYPGLDNPTQEALVRDGFYNSATSGCTGPSWNPSKADQSGLPHGNWCAATNLPGDAQCHDAWHSHSFHVFAAAKIKSGQTCPF